jgi:membrane protease subunit HflC
MNGRYLLLVAALVLGLVTVSQSFYEVRQTEYALRFRFRDIVGIDTTPGAYLKIPFVETVQFFEKRVMTRSYPAEQFLTSEGKILNVDFYVKWKIGDAAQYYRATGGNDEVAAGRLAEIVKDGLKGTIARRTIQQVVAAERAEFIQDVLVFAGNSVKELGISLVDVRVKLIGLPEEVSESVFKRMQQDFARQAAQLRAEGDEQAIKIRAEAERQRTEILAAASRDAERTRGNADTSAAEIYSKAYLRNPEFYAFHRSLQAYRRSLGRDHEVLVLSPDSDFFKYMKQPGGGR